MTNKKPVLLLLLMLCIGLVPLQNVNAGNMDHMESILVDCGGCDMDKVDAQGACDDAQCMMGTGYCGTQNITSILSRSFRASVHIAERKTSPVFFRDRSGHQFVDTLWSVTDIPSRLDINLTSIFRYTAHRLPEL